MKVLSSFLSLLLTPLVAVMPLSAELANGPAGPVPVATSTVGEASGATTPKGQSTILQIRLAAAASSVVEANSFQTGYSVVVTDASGIPVSDAAVAIRLPEDGATGFFVDGVHSAVAYTNAAGVATFAQVHWNSTLGVAGITVTAAKGELHAGVLLEQTIVQHTESASKPSAPAIKVVPINSTAAASNSAAAPLAKQAVPAPGTPASIASVHTGSAAGDPPQAAPAQTSSSATPAVSVVNSTTGATGNQHSNKKWIVVAVVAVGVGVGAAMALSLSGHGSVVPAAGAGVYIGSPSVSVGH